MRGARALVMLSEEAGKGVSLLALAGRRERAIPAWPPGCERRRKGDPMALMGLNNWLLLDEAEDGADFAIAFRWGEVGGHRYRLGEIVFWPEGRRPAQAGGEHLVPGLANGAPQGAARRGFIPLYYLIRIIDDLVVSVDIADEAQFAAAEAALVARGIPQ